MSTMIPTLPHRLSMRLLPPTISLSHAISPCSPMIVYREVNMLPSPVSPMTATPLPLRSHNPLSSNPVAFPFPEVSAAAHSSRKIEPRHPSNTTQSMTKQLRQSQKSSASSRLFDRVDASARPSRLATRRVVSIKPLMTPVMEVSAMSQQQSDSPKTSTRLTSPRRPQLKRGAPYMSPPASATFPEDQTRRGSVETEPVPRPTSLRARDRPVGVCITDERERATIQAMLAPFAAYAGVVG